MECKYVSKMEIFYENFISIIYIFFVFKLSIFNNHTRIIELRGFWIIRYSNKKEIRDIEIYSILRVKYIY